MCTRAVGALGHYLERGGVPTTQISLIREHSERIRPPRALWVPFELGCPFGVPHDAAFQTRVLEAALRLLEAASGPVLADFPDDAPDVQADSGPWACPLPLPAPVPQEADAGKLQQAFAREFAQLLPWYTLARQSRKRTTLGLSDLPPEEIGPFVARFLEDPLPSSPRDDLPLGAIFKLAAEDLKALYIEAVTAQPAGPTELARWFWNETHAGELLRALRTKLAQSDDPMLKLVANIALVPALLPP